VNTWWCCGRTGDSTYRLCSTCGPLSPEISQTERRYQTRFARKDLDFADRTMFAVAWRRGGRADTPSACTVPPPVFSVSSTLNSFRRTTATEDLRQCWREDVESTAVKTVMNNC